MKNIGFIGLGNLGLPIATNLLTAGYHLKVYNRTREKSSTLVARGAQAVDKPHEVADACGIVISLVADDQAVREVADDQFANALGPGGLHLSMSTISGDTSRALAIHHKKFGVQYVSAPVFARPEAAAARLGVVCISGGTVEGRRRAMPILTDGVAQRIVDFGDDAGSAHIVKLIGNFMIAASIEMMAEAFTLAEKNSIAPSAVYDMFMETLFASPVFQNYGRIILGRKFEPASFRLALGLKDVNLLLQTAVRSQTPLPLAELCRARMLKGIREGKGSLDWSSFAEEARLDAGLS